MSKLVKERPPIDRRRFSPVFPFAELQQTATAKGRYETPKQRNRDIFVPRLFFSETTKNSPEVFFSASETECLDLRLLHIQPSIHII